MLFCILIAVSLLPEKRATDLEVPASVTIRKRLLIALTLLDDWQLISFYFLYVKTCFMSHYWTLERATVTQHRPVEGA